MTLLESGATLLHYRIIEKIGEGGMGEVYKAYKQAADIVHMMASNVIDEDLRATFLGSPEIQEVLDGEKRVDSFGS